MIGPEEFLPECVGIYVSECVSHFVVHWAGFPIGRQLKTEKVCETAIFVLITENSNLKKRLQEEERNHHGFGTVRCVERGGTTQTAFCAPLRSLVPAWKRHWLQHHVHDMSWARKENQLHWRVCQNKLQQRCGTPECTERGARRPSHSRPSKAITPWHPRQLPVENCVLE